MIEVLGVPGNAEYDAALQLRELISRDWPDCVDSLRDRITIIPAVKCYGQRHQDIDLVILVRLRRPREIPDLAWTSEKKQVLSFVATIEVKDLPPPRVSFEGPKAFVTYRDGLRKDASEQCFGQVFSLLDYVKGKVRRQPHVAGVLWLRQCPDSYLPRVPNNLLGSDATWGEVLRKIAFSRKSWLEVPGNSLLQAYGELSHPLVEQNFDDLARFFSRKIECSPLDRQKVERITKKLMDGQDYVEKLGEQLLVFRGRGGTGKTIRLLRLAHDIYNERGQRTLFLTYNLALVSDVRRTLSIIGAASDADGQVMAIQSVHKFMLDLMLDGGLITAINEHALARYNELLVELDQLLSAFETTELPHYDFVFIDEAQDWPEAERDIIFKIFGPQRCIVADGVDQLVRANVPTEWTAKLRGTPHRVVPLRQSLRLKASLSTFAAAVAQRLELGSWNLQVNRELHGGSIEILVGPGATTGYEELKRVASSFCDDGCLPIDSLVCVPFTSSTADDTRRLIGLIESLGWQTWDGTDRANRTGFPTDVGQMRFVTYDSCRGLEGWNVMCFAIDKLLDHRIRHYAPTAGAQDLYTTPEVLARRHAASWLMIPLTRAIDRLVIHVEDPQHWIADVFRRVRAELGADCDWLTIRECE